MDADITTADSLGVNRINAQTSRDAQRALQAHQQALIRNEIEYMALVRETLPLTLRDQITVAIADKYMTTSTSTVPATVLADAVADAARLKAAVDEVLKTLA